MFLLGVRTKRGLGGGAGTETSSQFTYVTYTVWFMAVVVLQLLQMKSGMSPSFRVFNFGCDGRSFKLLG